MISKEQREILVEKRRVELLALNINPDLYAIVYKFLYKRTRVYMNPYHGGIDIIRTDMGSKYPVKLDEDGTVRLLNEYLDIEFYQAYDIAHEWVREKKVERYMMDSTKYYDFLTIPLPRDPKVYPKKSKKPKKDEWNF